jgi:hypothetical protein
MSKVFDWIVSLVYTHQFGSDNQRTELAQDLLKSILNDRLSGLYCIDLGSFDELYDTMNINQETYPRNQYGSYHLYKYGMSKDIYARLKQHQNKANGYAQWSDKVSLKWLILMSDSQLSEAESLLAEKFKAKGLSFDYTDRDGKRHTELVAVGPRDEAKVKTIYKQTITYFPSKENDLYKLIEDMHTQHELDGLKRERDITLKLHQQELTILEHESTIKMHQQDLMVQSLTHQNEMLKMQLTLSKHNLL